MPAEQHEEIFLKPGECYFGTSPERIRTLLGSCIAVTLWHPLLAKGGMVHCLLPSWAPGEDVLQLSGRYVDQGVFWLLREAARACIDPGQCEFKVFGGSNMFAAFGVNAGARRSIGDANAKKAVAMLEGLGLRIGARDLGGSVHRSLVFDLSTGDVWVRHGEYDSTPGNDHRICA